MYPVCTPQGHPSPTPAGAYPGPVDEPRYVHYQLIYACDSGTEASVECVSLNFDYQ